MATQNGPGKDRRRGLTAQEKYQVWLEVVARQASQREIADRWGVDRSTVIEITHVAKQSALDGLAQMTSRSSSRMEIGRPDHR